MISAEPDITVDDDLSVMVEPGNIGVEVEPAVVVDIEPAIEVEVEED